MLKPRDTTTIARNDHLVDLIEVSLVHSLRSRSVKPGSRAGRTVSVWVKVAVVMTGSFE